MRTTVDLPPGVLARVRGIASDRRTSVSKVISGFVQEALEGPTTDPSARLHRDPATGLVLLRLPTVITSADVRAADAE
jgi:hypothetical protein